MTQAQSDGDRGAGHGAIRFNSPDLPVTAQWFANQLGVDQVADWTKSELNSAAMAQRLQRIASGGHAVIRKWAPVAETAALSLAQTIRPEAQAIPELIETGHDDEGTWYITPEYTGSPTTALTSTALDSLARMHAHFRGASTNHPDIPVIDAAWWHSLCDSWVQPAIERQAVRHGKDVAERARRLLDSCRNDAPLTDLLSTISPTLLHGDIHPGNVLTGGGETHLIDWGSARFGTPLLDLLNLMASDSPQLHTYLDAYSEYASRPLDADEITAGRQWSAVQIPLQYLPWTLENGTTSQVETALARIGRALNDITDEHN